MPKKSPRISIIAAIDEKGGIGKNNKIPWHIRKDLIRLRDMTRNRLVILGRNSYESMAGYYDISGREMPAREYIVLTKNKDFKSERKNTFTATSIKAVLDRIEKSGEKEVFVIGGATIYAQFMKFTDRLYLTTVKGNFNCDTFFPDYSKFKKELFSEKGSDEGIDFVYKVLES